MQLLTSFGTCCVKHVRRGIAAETREWNRVWIMRHDQHAGNQSLTVPPGRDNVQLLSLTKCSPLFV
jgi:hypothetical protein